MVLVPGEIRAPFKENIRDHLYKDLSEVAKKDFEIDFAQLIVYDQQMRDIKVRSTLFVF